MQEEQRRELDEAICKMKPEELLIETIDKIIRENTRKNQAVGAGPAAQHANAVADEGLSDQMHQRPHQRQQQQQQQLIDQRQKDDDDKVPRKTAAGRFIELIRN